MPEPNLLSLNLKMFDINKIQSCIPELPNITRENIMSKYGLDIRKTSILMVIEFKKKICYLYLLYLHFCVERTCFVDNVL